VQVFISSFTNDSWLRSLAESPKKDPVNGQISPSDWPPYGRDLAGSHYNPLEKIITPATASRLKTKWIFEAEGDASSQPIAVNGVVYLGSWRCTWALRLCPSAGRQTEQQTSMPFGFDGRQAYRQNRLLQAP
jgi:glucose dehydrogenase